MTKTIELRTTKRVEFIDINGYIMNFLSNIGAKNGILIIYSPHTTAGITINENADPDVKSDIIRKLNEVFPQKDGYDHFEGNSDAHIKTSLIGTSETLIIEEGKPILGIWQSVYFCEFDGARNRKVVFKFIEG